MQHDYTEMLETAEYIIKISPRTEYGYFENKEYGTNGGLWFDGSELMDYDGVTELPQEILDALKGAGYDVRYVEGDYENDGQPDEMQEWQDFDPEC